MAIGTKGSSPGNVLPWTPEGMRASPGSTSFRVVARALGVLALLLGAVNGCSDLPPTVQGKVAKDLVALMDLDGGDCVKGKWTKDDSGLHTTTTSFGRTQIPYRPGSEYDVKLVCQRSGNTDMIALGLLKGDVQFVIGIDGSTRFVSSGIDRVDGKPFSENEFTVKKTVLDNSKASTILVNVRDTVLTVTVDGTTLFEWKDKDKAGKETGKPLDYSRLSLSPDWTVPLGKALFLGAFTEYTVTTLELTNVTNRGTYLR
ncbi:MAG TPA: hypothetical protein VKU80_18895 [Planctomycetota bacterium]|nr:hypothetical protein [Planctomycetota bacterium]